MLNHIKIKTQEKMTGAWAVVAVIQYEDGSKTYEHPVLNNLIKKEASEYCQQVIDNNPGYDEIITTWHSIND